MRRGVAGNLTSLGHFHATLFQITCNNYIKIHLLLGLQPQQIDHGSTSVEQKSKIISQPSSVI